MFKQYLKIKNKFKFKLYKQNIFLTKKKNCSQLKKKNVKIDGRQKAYFTNNLYINNNT